MFPRYALSTLVAVAALTACQQAETVEQMQARMQMESDSARVAIEARGVAFAEATNAGNADGVAAMYAEDAVLMPPDMPAVTGRDNIRSTFAAMMGQMPGMRIAFQVQDVVANGPLAVERGAWIITVPTPDGGSSEMRGKYLVAWRRIDGEWMMARDIWNNDAPMPPAPGM
jgi:uncharacterized protein (TIGR02246 family)